MALFVQDLNYLQTRSGEHSSSGAKGHVRPRGRLALSMMVKRPANFARTKTFGNDTARAVKGERYAFRATNGRTRNIVGTRFTS